jgi:hypothetical protein
MDENGREQAKNINDSLKPLNSTNIWGALELGLQLSRKEICK